MKVRYHLPNVALKRQLLREGGFHQALSTYLHERAHCFGGDQSHAFSEALTEILQATLKETGAVKRARTKWERLQKAFLDGQR